ncbi:hypothetical protein JAAARDRAFT_189385 [Jaapia argillacea MUCL 33604]|uniref:C3H1-type domain-containing protein n=1 Tax=Jaapia argillacea MUCL 33604 TaxID=933084 RepID=A0A067QA53_9AGAM|nr:hypothetical protein JAAARDRAFT_189385 [Jaapia argillacea MUCL 33604]
MIIDPSSELHLKLWLVRTLEPICDAEPGALANYVIALLRHTAPEAEMRKELGEQLEEFLEKESVPFIDTLFTVLRTKSYLPYSAPSPSPPLAHPASGSQPVDNGIPIPLDGLLSPSIPTSPGRDRKRTFDYDDRDSHPPAKGPRISTEGQFSRYANGRPDNRSTGSWGVGGGDRYDRGRDDGMSMGVNNGANGSGFANGRQSHSYRPPDQKRGICRDYFHKGYCGRGNMCKFSHGDDAVVPAQLFPMNGQPVQGAPLPFLPMYPTGVAPFGMGAAPGAAYDPHERIDMRPKPGRASRAPIMPRPEDGTTSVPDVPGELPVIQDLTPRMPLDDAESLRPQSYSSAGYGQTVGSSSGPSNISMEVDVPAVAGPPQPLYGPPRGGMRGGRGRGTFSAEVHSFRPERKRDDKTLVVEKIPADKLNLESVNSWFKQFGTVTNVAIDASNAKALVSFSNHDEAHAAWRSEDAVFNNRFVKIFWHRPLEGHGQLGQRMLAASASRVANMTAKEESPGPTSHLPISPTSTTIPSRKTPSSTMSALAAKQQLLEQQIAEQKDLMAKLSTASVDDKKEILARLRKLGEEMKAPSTNHATNGASSPLPSASSSRKLATTPVTEDREQKERERLDKELDLHAAVTATDGEESKEDLQVQLAKLKAEAASLGIPETYGSTSSSYRPYRGRGRGGRGYYRGAMRGGPPPRASMKLDNRPKSILVKGVDNDGVQGVRDWFETTGQVESVDPLDSGDLLVSFRSRSAAEQGMAKGSNIPVVGQVQLSWYTGRHSDSVAKSAKLELATDPEKHMTDGSHSDLLHPHLPDEEIVVSGWGDSEDGMGLL